MKKRLQVVFTEEAWAAVEALTNDANQNFDVGTISFSDAINEMVLSSRVDIKTLQNKHTDIRRTLRVMASQENVDIDSVIKNLKELKSNSVQKKTIPTTQEVT
jgi:hypothetical protein